MTNSSSTWTGMVAVEDTALAVPDTRGRSTIERNDFRVSAAAIRETAGAHDRGAR